LLCGTNQIKSNQWLLLNDGTGALTAARGSGMATTTKKEERLRLIENGGSELNTSMYALLLLQYLIDY
jgi:hypothetical protein